MLVERPHVGILEKCFIVLVKDVGKIGRQLKNRLLSISTKHCLFAKGNEESNLVGMSKQKLALDSYNPGIYLPLALTCGTNTTERL